MYVAPVKEKMDFAAIESFAQGGVGEGGSTSVND